jgi:hypothetical protein
MRRATCRIVHARDRDSAPVPANLPSLQWRSAPSRPPDVSS